MNSHNELVLQKSRTVKLMGLLATFKMLKYLSLMALLDLSWMAEFFTKLSRVTLKKIYFHFKIFEQVCYYKKAFVLNNKNLTNLIKVETRTTQSCKILIVIL